jgi:hypothetical protein
VWGTGDKTVDYVWRDHGIAGILCRDTS